MSEHLYRHFLKIFLIIYFRKKCCAVFLQDLGVGVMALDNLPSLVAVNNISLSSLFLPALPIITSRFLPSRLSHLPSLCFCEG